MSFLSLENQSFARLKPNAQAMLLHARGVAVGYAVGALHGETIESVQIKA
jgi:hypothetical protein